MKTRILHSTLLLGLAPLAHAQVIDFDSLAPGTIVDNEFAPLVSVSVENLGGGPNVAVVFDTLNPTGHDFDLGGPFNSNTPDLPDNFIANNVLIIHERFDCDARRCAEPDDEGSRPAGRFFFEFSTPIRLESIDFFDVETAENGRRPENAIRLFDAGSNELMPATFFTPDTGGDNLWDRLAFNVDGVRRIELNMGGSGAIDNITYAIIPVPSAVWLFGCGLIGLVALARRGA